MGFEPIGFVVERVYDLLKYEATILLVDEERAMKELQQKLEVVDAYLRDIDEVKRVASQDRVFKTKVKQLKRTLVDIEDFLDTVIDQKQHPAPPSFFKKSKAFFSRASNPVIKKHQFVAKITELIEALGRTEDYELPNDKVPKTKLRSSPGIIDHEIIIGLEEDVAYLVSKFVGKEGECGANSAIVGMGGLGKTTLARKFYNHEEIKKVFPRRAWVCVSQQWDTLELLLQIYAEIGVRLSRDDERSIPILQRKLTEFLREEGSCLVVLDDVWERAALNDFLPPLLTGNCRVLITTRKEQIFHFPEIPPFHVHIMRRLTKKQSRELFSKIVCNNGIVEVKFIEEEADGEEGGFAKLGREMLEKCDGLPIAIITLAGLLGTKDSIQDWKSIKDNMISVIMKDENNGPLGYDAVKKVLEYSYSDLPYDLKPCFLYLGIFKEDEKIEIDTLINLWIDEGFIKTDQDFERGRLKEKAKNFLKELVQRCMVQVVSRDYAGDVEEIRIHDLMRDLCIDKAKKLDFFRVFSPSTISSVQIESCNRLVIQNHDNDSAESKVLLEFNSPLRTFIWNKTEYTDILLFVGSLYFGFEHLPPKPLFPLEKLKQVRVLTLFEVDLRDSAKHIGNMVLLRYLRLRMCSFTTGKTDFLKKLRNLQTLKLVAGSVELCDNMVGNMEQLRVLCLLNLRESPTMNTMGVDKLRNLQTLEIHADEWIVKDLPSIITTDLQYLKIWEIHSQQQLDAILDYVNNSSTVTCLETLELDLKSGSLLLEFDLEKMKLDRCQHLKFLSLSGKIKKQRGSMWSFPPNLLSLYLLRTEVEEEDDMNQVIAQVAHLRELQLFDGAYKGASLTTSGLPNLHKLDLRTLPSLKEWRITNGSLPQLRELSIWDCSELERIPDEIRNIKTLQLLDVRSMPRRFCKRLKKREEGEIDGGEHFHIVQHIPTLTFEHIKD